MRINYQIMDDSQLQPFSNMGNKCYLPNYDELIKNSTCEEEANEWRNLKDENCTFIFKVVYATKLKCGHWEVSQSNYNEYFPIEYVLDKASKFALESDCRKCMSGYYIINKQKL